MNHHILIYIDSIFKVWNELGMKYYELKGKGITNDFKDIEFYENGEPNRVLFSIGHVYS